VHRYPLDDRGSFAWIAGPDEPLLRASTALAIDGGCLLIDPVDHPDLDAAVVPVGPVRGVVTLLDRHDRDADAVAGRHGAPRLVPGVLAGRGEPLAVPGVQERVVLSVLGWNESALWVPDRALLVVADALGTIPQFLASDADPLGVHPLLRLRPPRGALAVEPRAIAVGHGTPVTVDAAAALRRALETARSGLPATWGRAALQGLRRLRR
jgi:hypothetical protein